jgi:hypothetical protein
MMRKSTLSLLLILILYNLAGAIDPLTISKTSLPPKIDGIIDSNDPWTTTWINMIQNKDANTSSDVTGKFQLTYDENNLYLAVICTGDKSLDTSSADIPNSYESDCIEVYLNMDTSTCVIEMHHGMCKPGDYQFRMSRGSIFPNRFDPGPMWCDWRHSDFNIGQTEGVTSYTQEWQMPWAVLTDSSGMNPAWDGKQFKFNIKISDNTTGSGSGRTQELLWYPSPTYNIVWYEFGLVSLLSTDIKTSHFIELFFFTNQANNELRINAVLAEESVISIFNLEGKQVLTTKITGNKIVDIGYLRTGVYLVKINEGKEKYSGKFIKR